MGLNRHTSDLSELLSAALMLLDVIVQRVASLSAWFDQQRDDDEPLCRVSPQIIVLIWTFQCRILSFGSPQVVFPCENS